jgi:NADPH-dependent curcumin reductase CurA
MLDTALKHLALNARVVLCGAISQYDDASHTGIRNMWELITKRARAEGFMFSDYIDDYAAASAELAQWIAAGKLTAPLNLSRGIASTPTAFCAMLTGKNRGKSLVILD